MSNPRKKKPVDYHALAEKRGFVWLGVEVPNVSTKTKWQCAKDHVWQAMYRKIKDGTGCPTCSKSGPKFKMEDGVDSGLRLPAADLKTIRDRHGSKWQDWARAKLAPHIEGLRGNSLAISLNWKLVSSGEFPSDRRRVLISYYYFDKAMVAESRYLHKYQIWEGHMDVYAWCELPTAATEAKATNKPSSNLP